MASFSNNDFGITFNIRLSGIGSPARFDFYAFTKEFDEPEVWDFAPDGDAWWSFVVQEQPPGGGGGGGGGGGPPDFVAKGSAMSPDPPHAGDSVAVGTRFVYRESGKVVTTGRLTCTGTIGSRSIRGRPVRDSRLHACFFDLPRDSGGQRFTGRVTLTLGTREHSIQRGGRIVPASALTITGPNTKPSNPVAGQQYSAAFKVEVVQPGKPPRRITDGEIDCRATAGGKPVGFDFKGFFASSAVCAWQLPASARGTFFQGTIMVRARGMTATKTFSRRVR
jgi:hypothetical protein